MTETKVIREFYAIRYSRSDFGARPDLTHPELVSHELSLGRYVFEECESIAAAYRTAHAALGKIVEDDSNGSRGLVMGDVCVLRVAEHAPVEIGNDGIFDPPWLPSTVSMTVTGVDRVKGIPHFVDTPLTRYEPVNGWVTPATVIVDRDKLRNSKDFT